MSLQLQTIPTLCCPTFGHSDPAWWRKRSGIEWIFPRIYLQLQFLVWRRLGLLGPSWLLLQYNTLFNFLFPEWELCLVWARVCLHTRADVIYFAGKFEAWKLRAIPSSVASRHAARFATRKVRVVSCMERSVIYHLQYSLLHFNFIQKENFECVQSTRTHISVVCKKYNCFSQVNCIVPFNCFELSNVRKTIINVFDSNLSASCWDADRKMPWENTSHISPLLQFPDKWW